MKTTKLSVETCINFWRQSLKQALKSGDVMYAMHCDKMINKLIKIK
tara:strand:+ start:1325 stop:1462 length:138 start_codon:yes stop_codon:yes gene_type:complete